MKRTLACALFATNLVLLMPTAHAAERPRPWRQHLAMHMQTPKINTPTEVRKVLDKRRDEIRAGWESWKRDYQNHLEYEEALRATEILPAEETSPSSIEPVFAPTATGGTDWWAIAECESGGDWTIDSTYDGGLQFHPDTWNRAGGTAYAPYAYLATPAQQIAVAASWAETVGCVHCSAGWPVCGIYG